jgi:polyhydroxyalkanoate synthase subunit PhaE
MVRAMEFFDLWLESQEKAIEDWAETTRKLKQALIRQRVFKLTGIKRASSEAPGRELIDVHNAWLTLMSASMHASDRWMRGMEAWAETVKQFQQSFLNQKEMNRDPAERPETRPPDPINAWIPLLEPLVERKKPDIAKETAFKLFGSFHLYKKFYEACQPLFGIRQEKTLDVSPREIVIYPSTYKEIMDTLFGIGPESATEVYMKARKLLASWGLTDRHEGAWAEALKRTEKAFPPLFEGRLDFIISTMHDMFGTLDPFSSFAASTDEEEEKRTELLLALCDSISAYMSKITGYQRLIYATGLKSMNRVIEATFEGMGEGQATKSFDDFFHLWLKVCEKDYQVLFASEEFSKLYGDLMDAAMKARIYTFKLTELHLAHTPLVVRSEIDDLYKTMQDLKREVRALKKERQNPNKNRKRPGSKTHGPGGPQK